MKPSSRLAIVADSHGAIDRLDQMLARLKKSGIKYCLHVGDFAVYGVAEVMKKYPEIKIWIAQGNADVNEEILNEVRTLPNVEMKEIIKFELAGIKIAASHIEGIAEGALRNEKIDIFCHGHTHRSKTEKRDKKIILNPGALVEDGKYFLLSLPDGNLEIKRFDE